MRHIIVPQRRAINPDRIRYGIVPLHAGRLRPFSNEYVNWRNTERRRASCHGLLNVLRESQNVIDCSAQGWIGDGRAGNIGSPRRIAECGCRVLLVVHGARIDVCAQQVDVVNEIVARDY